MRASAAAMVGNGTGQHMLVERLLVEHHIGLDATTARGARRHARGILVLARANPLGAIDRSARLANVAMDRSVQLKHALRARHLMQAVDVLRHHDIELASSLQLGELGVTAVGLSVKRDHLGAVKVEELRRMRLVKAVREHGLGRVGKLLVIQAVNAAKIGNAACRGNTSATKEHHALVGIEQLRQRGGGLLGICYRLRHVCPPSMLVGAAAIAPSPTEPTPPLLR